MRPILNQIILTAALLRTMQAEAQDNLVRQFENNISPSIALLSRQDIYFKWNIAGIDQAAMNEGLNQMREDHFGQAITNFGQVIEHQPEFYAAYYYRGLCYKFLGKLLEAEKNFLKVVRYNDTLSVAYIELGKLRLMMHDRAKARTRFETAAKVRPESAGLVALGDLEFLEKHFAKADSLYEESITLDPKFAEGHSRKGLLILFRNADKPTALARFDRALRADSTMQEALFWHGVTLATSNKVRESLNDWNKLVRLNPTQPLFLLMRATVHIELDETDAAFADMRKFSQLSEISETEFGGQQSNIDRRIDLQTALKYTVRKLYGLSDPSIEAVKSGFCKLLVGQYVNAAYAFTKISENTSLRHYLIALASEHGGNHGVAFTSYERALELDNEIIDAHKKRGIYLMEMQRMSDAEKDFNEMIRLQPELFTAYKLRGLLRAHQGRCEEAIADVDKFITVDSTDQDAYKTRGFCHERLNDFRQACDDYWKSFAANPKNREMMIVVIDKYSVLVRQEPKNGVARFRLGQGYIASGNLQRGLDEIRRAQGAGSEEATEFLKFYRKAMREQSRR